LATGAPRAPKNLDSFRPILPDVRGMTRGTCRCEVCGAWCEVHGARCEVRDVRCAHQIKFGGFGTGLRHSHLCLCKDTLRCAMCQQKIEQKEKCFKKIKIPSKTSSSATSCIAFNNALALDVVRDIVCSRLKKALCRSCRFIMHSVSRGGSSSEASAVRAAGAAAAACFVERESSRGAKKDKKLLVE